MQNLKSHSLCRKTVPKPYQVTVWMSRKCRWGVTREEPVLGPQVRIVGGEEDKGCLDGCSGTFYTPFLVLQMKMPSKKCAHIPVYTLGFESLQRVPTTKATPTLRRDAFQYAFFFSLLLVCCGSGELNVTGKLGQVSMTL